MLRAERTTQAQPSMAETQTETTGREFLDFMATSLSRERNPPEVLVGFLILGSFFHVLHDVRDRSLLDDFQHGHEKKLTLTRQLALWFLFVVWGSLSSAIVSGIVGYMVVMAPQRARWWGWRERRAERRTRRWVHDPQYVTFLGMSLGTMILYRNCGRGWSPVFEKDLIRLIVCAHDKKSEREREKLTETERERGR